MAIAGHSKHNQYDSVWLYLFELECIDFALDVLVDDVVLLMAPVAGRQQLELRVDAALPDPTRRIVVYCELGKISTLAAATLRQLGFSRAVALDGGFRNWREAGLTVETVAVGGSAVGSEVPESR